MTFSAKVNFMESVLTIEQIREQYQDAWVLIEDPQTDEFLEVLAGKVLYHSHNRDEFDREILKFHPKRSAVVYTGEIMSEGVAFAL
jgi:hypothetical protein